MNAFKGDTQIFDKLKTCQNEAINIHTTKV